MWEVWSWGHIHVIDLLFANPTEVSSEVLIHPFLPYQPRCILNAKIIKASLFLQRSMWEQDFSQAEGNHAVCLAWVSNVFVLGPGSPSSKWCQNSFDRYTQNHQRRGASLRAMSRAWQSLLTKAPGFWYTQNLLAFCSSAEASSCPSVFTVLMYLRNQKWRWTHKGPTKLLTSSTPASVFHALCLIQPYTVVEASVRGGHRHCRAKLLLDRNNLVGGFWVTSQ